MALNVLIGGGSGFIGRALTDILRRKGHSVTIISRQEGKSDRISWESIRENGLPPNTDAVINLSGTPINPLKRFQMEEHKREIESSRIEPTRWLTKAILSSASKPEVWISASGIGYYPSSFSAVYDEDSPGGSGEYFAMMAKKWEEAAKLPEECTAVRQAVIRIGVVLGKDGGVIKSMMVPYQLGLGGPAGSGKQYFPWIHIQDAAGIFAHAIENKNAVGIFNAVSPEIATNSEFSTKFARSLNRPAFFRVPEFVAKLVMGNDLAVLLLGGQNAVPKRTLEFGYKFTHPNLEEALINL